MDALVVHRIGFARDQILGEIDPHFFTEEAGAGPEFDKFGPTPGAIAGFFLEFAFGGAERRFARIDFAGGNFPKMLARGEAVLLDQKNPASSVGNQYSGRTRMLNHGALDFEPIAGARHVLGHLKKAVRVLGFGRNYLHLLMIALAWGEENGGTAERERVREAVRKWTAAEKASEEYLYERRMLRREFDAEGKIKSESDTTIRRDPWDELIVTRVIAQNGRALSETEKAEQEERLRKAVIETRRRAGKPKPEPENFFEELPAAMNYRVLGTETREGRVLDVIALEPRPGYVPKGMRARAFAKLRGKLWLDRVDNEIAKVEAEVFDSVNVGFGPLARIEKGTRFELERYPFAGQWLTTWQRARYGVKVMLVKTLRREMESWFSNYAKRPGRP